MAGALQNRVSGIDSPPHKYPPHSSRGSAFLPDWSPPSLPTFLTSTSAPGRNQATMSAVQLNSEQQIIERKQSASDSIADGVEKGVPQEDVEETKGHSWTSYARLRPFILVGLALLILAWWISSIVLQATRHRWFVFQVSFCLDLTFTQSIVSSRIVQTFWAWTFIL